MSETTPQRTSRAERARMPRTADLIREVAIENRVCIKPLPMEATDAMGNTKLVDIPCGSTKAAKCPVCAAKAKKLRMAQCREGWHLESEPIQEPDSATDTQRQLGRERADLTARLATAVHGNDLECARELETEIENLDERIASVGIRGQFPKPDAKRRVRSTRRRNDAVDLPKRKTSNTTIGRAYTSPEGQVFRPSLFVTVTLGSYGRIASDGTPADPTAYDYKRAARDAIHFSKVIDRLMQNMRRVAGFQVQYFGAVEPQRRLAMHFHMAMRGTMPRAEIKQIVAATYHQVWWPSTDRVVYEYSDTPIWSEAMGRYVDPATGCALPTWDEALDSVGDQPMHVVRLGQQSDIQGLIAGSPDADRRVGYMTKYLTKSIDECHTAHSAREQDHTQRLVDALRYEPCSPTCANWLRYGVEPKNPRQSMRPGYCRGKSHRRENLGYGGRRILVSSKWSGKNLSDHRADRRRWVMETLGIKDDDEAQQVSWLPLTSTSAPALNYRLLLAIADRKRWRADLDRATLCASGLAPPKVSTTLKPTPPDRRSG